VHTLDIVVEGSSNLDGEATRQPVLAGPLHGTDDQEGSDAQAQSYCRAVRPVDVLRAYLMSDSDVFEHTSSLFSLPHRVGSMFSKPMKT
jgi:hypothetical protein